MALEQVVLDDLTWADFNAASLLRIPAASAAQWTLNAPVDPGMTLLDLFAWLLEQRVYRMDHVSDSFTRALLGLLGIAPLKAQAATTVLYIEPFWNGGAPKAVTREKGQEVRLKKGLSPPVFTTSDPLTIYPLAAKNAPGRFRAPSAKLQVGGVDRSADLSQGRSPALFGPTTGDTEIVLSLDSNAGAPLQGTLTLLFDLLTPPGIAPDWSPPDAGGPVAVPPGPNPVSWLVSINGTLTALDAAKIKDGTHGLRQSGIVQLPIPAGWSPIETGASDYAIVLRGSSAGWPTPPRVRRLIPNVVAAVHSRMPAELTTDYIQKQVQVWRLLPGNVFVLPEVDRPALDGTISVSITDRGASKSVDWKLVDDLNMYGPDDPVYVYDAASARLRFGDGVRGRLPIPKDPSSVTVSYQVGGGAAGNLGSSLPWEFVEAAPINIWNVVPASGGVDAEKLLSVRQRAPEQLKATTRAITASDFEQLAVETPGTSVARAHAAIGRHPFFPNQVVPGAITLFLVPDVPRNADESPDYGNPKPPSGGLFVDAPTREAVAAYLAKTRMVASEVFVEPAAFRPVTISLSITASPSDTGALRTSIEQALQTYFDPLIGGDDGNGWPFGGFVRPSSLLRITQKVLGDQGTVDSVSITLDDVVPKDTQGCADVDIGQNNLITLTNVGVAIKRPTVGRGGLR
jgi:hypothetical protein